MWRLCVAKPTPSRRFSAPRGLGRGRQVRLQHGRDDYERDSRDTPYSAGSHQTIQGKSKARKSCFITRGRKPTIGDPPARHVSTFLVSVKRGLLKDLAPSRGSVGSEPRLVTLLGHDVFQREVEMAAPCYREAPLRNAAGMRQPCGSHHLL